MTVLFVSLSFTGSVNFLRVCVCVYVSEFFLSVSTFVRARLNICLSTDINTNEAHKKDSKRTVSQNDRQNDRYEDRTTGRHRNEQTRRREDGHRLRRHTA